MKYIVSAKIGDGSFGTVYLAEDELEHEIALKQMPKRKNRASAINRELNVLKILHDVKGIPKLLDFFEDTDSYWMAFSFVEGDDLLSHLSEGSAFDEEEARIIFQQIVSTLQLLHSSEILHNDLKCENVMYLKESKQVTLIDFGLSEYAPSGKTSSHCGSEPYMCPLKLQKQHKKIHYKEIDGNKSEVWRYC